ncbi:MAG: prepilin-type N-terminal cleavage/methylation domain-containing protein [Patescibacteria group bacterium]
MRSFVRQGFTLIELLLVIGIISVLVAITIQAIHPTKQLGDARNAERQVEVQTILNAVHQYAVEENRLPPSILSTEKEICGTGAVCTGGIDLSVLMPNYLVAIPGDPQATGTGTLYTIFRTAAGRVTVSAPQAEQGQAISISR